jgi:hypothetical protein
MTYFQVTFFAIITTSALPHITRQRGHYTLGQVVTDGFISLPISPFKVRELAKHILYTLIFG